MPSSESVKKATKKASGRVTPAKSKELKVTSSTDWRKPAEGFEVELPSGKVAKVRRTLDIIEMMKSGKVPNVLKGVVAEALNEKDPTKIDLENLDPDMIGDMFTMVDQIVIGMMIEPRVLPNPERKPDEEDWQYNIRLETTDPPEGYVWLGDVDPEDRLFLFNIAQGGTTDVAQFREEQERGMGDLLNGQAVQDKAE